MAKNFLAYQYQNPEFLNNYLKYSRYISFRAETTVNESYYDLRTFLRYIKIATSDENCIENMNISELQNISIKDLTLEDMNKVTHFNITDFIYFLRYNLDNCAKTRNKKLASIKRFFEYLYINNLITNNPAQNIQAGKLEKRLPKYLTLKESKTMLSKTINSEKKFKIRNYAITCILLNCSIRLSELVNINLTDFKLDDKTLRIKGKGGLERIIYLNDATTEVIEEYLKCRPSLPKSNVDYNALFISGRNKRISKRTVQQIIEDELYMTFNEKKDGFHTHTLRHTGATLMYNENNTNIFILKLILGHKHLSSTEGYTHISSKKLQELMQNFNIFSTLLEEGEEKNE